MILYNTRTQKLPLSTEFYTNNVNALKMFRYNETLMTNWGDYRIQEQVTSDVYYTYNTIQTIIIDVQDLMRFLAKQEIVKESGCNLKRNYF